MSYSKKKNTLSFPLFCFVTFFLFFFFSCTHFKLLKPSDFFSKTQSKYQNEKESYDSLRKGLALFRKNELSEAREWLEKLNYEEEGFLFALLEIQKINYIEKDWDRFFGLASYYRKKLLYSPEMATKNFKQEMLTLEILALIRHCRYPEASQVIEWSLALAENIKKSSSKIKKTIYFLKLKTQTGDEKVKRTDWEKQINLWPVDPKNINRLDNPKYLRMKVDSKC